MIIVQIAYCDQASVRKFQKGNKVKGHGDNKSIGLEWIELDCVPVYHSFAFIHDNATQ